MDPRVEAEQYLDAHKIPQLIEVLTSQLLFNKPDNPREFIIKYLENVKKAGTQPLLNEQDLETMFGMFDVTNKGVIQVEQANNALRSILGPTADIRKAGLDGVSLVKKDAFVKAMMQALQEAVPYRA